MFNTILVALETSDLDNELLRNVLRLARREDVQLVLAHVVNPHEGDEYGGAEDQAIGLRVRASQRRLDSVAERLQKEGVDAEARVVLGEPSDRILKLAEEVEASAIALATHGRSGPSRWLGGSVTEAVLRWTNLPVFVVNPIEAGHDEKTGFAKILVPLDGSERAGRILAGVRAFAELYGSEVTLLRVGINPSVHYHDLAVGGSPAPIPPLRETLEKSLESTAAALSGVPLKIKTRLAETASAGVLDELAESDYDLVALGTHGRTGLDRLLFGSTAEAVARECPVPLLIYRDAQLVEDAEEAAKAEA